jgi:hypothetical protein
MPNMPSYAVMPQGQPAYPVAGLPNNNPPQRWSVPAQPLVAMPSAPRLAMPSPPAFASAVPPGQPRPKVRGVAEESGPPPAPTPVRIALPSPESLGIKLGASRVEAAPVVIDWNQVHARLEKLGIVNYEHGRLPQGGFRVVLAVQTHQVEATGETAAAAVLLALQRAEGLVVEAGKN